MMPVTLKLLTLPALALLAACSGTTPPSFSVHEAYVASKTEAGTVINVVVDARNPTNEPMPLWNLDYSADLSGAAVAPVSRWTQATVSPMSTVRFELPVVTTAAATGSQPLNLRAIVGYVPGGRFRELLTEVGVSLPTTSFTGQAMVNLDETPRVPTAKPGRITTATVIEKPARSAADTLPPLPPSPISNTR